MALLILILLVILFIRRRRARKDDRSLHLFDAKESALNPAYIPEISFPRKPDPPLSSSKNGDTRVWHQKNWVDNLAVPVVVESTVHADTLEPDDLMVRSIFDTEPKLRFEGPSVVQHSKPFFVRVGVWNEEEAKAEAQQRRREQREAAWTRKKLERLEQNSANRYDGEQADESAVADEFA